MSLSTCKLNVQIGSFNVATNELLPSASKSSSSSSGRSKASDDLDLAFWLEKSLSPSPDLIAIGFQELLPQTSLRLLSIPTEQAVFIQKGDDRSTLASISVNSAEAVTVAGDAASLADASSTPKKDTIRLGSQHIAGLEGWLEKLQETISRIHGVQVIEAFFVCNSYRTS